MKQRTKGTALVTGGTKRIGQGIAFGLASRGFHIALHYNRSRSDALATSSKIKRKGVQCEIFPCDLSDETQTVSLIMEVKKRFPNLSVLVNCASIFEKSRLRDSNIHSLNKHFTVNFISPYVLSCDFTRLCKKGQIINILDANFVRNKTSYCDYLLSKKALADFTDLAAVEFAPHIRVNAIAPGLILPPKGKKAGYLNRLAKDIPLRRRGNITHITKSVEFLIENDYLTGQIIFADGGEHLLG